MKTRLAIALVASLALPALSAAQEREWEEDYTDSWNDDGREPVDVQVDADNTPTSTLDQSFEAGLNPYGGWVSVSSYGRVWRPNVATGWRPYYYGRWEWTSEGWLWASDEPFGWATYHYGRWAYDQAYGWVWVPGYQWAPAWVSWRTSGDVIGWAPLAPGFSLYLTTYPFVDFWWTFMPCNQFVSYPVYRHAYAHHHARDHFYRTAPAPARPAPRPGMARAAPMPAWGGPSPRAVEDRMGRRITPVRVVAAPSPGSSSRPGEVAIYRPGRAARDGRDYTRGAAPSRGGRDGGAWSPGPSRGGRDGAWTPPGRGGDVRPAPSGRPDRGGERGGTWAPSPTPAPRRDAEGRREYVPQPQQQPQRERESRSGGWSPPAQRQPERGSDRGGYSAPSGGRGGESRSSSGGGNRGGESRGGSGGGNRGGSRDRGR